MAHFGLKPCTIQVGKPHENGDVESLNGVLKRRVEQHLLLRGNRDFASAEILRVLFGGDPGFEPTTRADRNFWRNWPGCAP